MGELKKFLLVGLIAAFLLLGGTLNLDAAQQSSGQSDASTTSPKKTKNKAKKSESAPSAAQAPGADSAPPGSAANAAAAKPQAPAASRTVWVNTDSGIYHRPGSRYYGKTKKGKYMTEADAIKAGYRAAGNEKK